MPLPLLRAGSLNHVMSRSRGGVAPNAEVKPADRAWTNGPLSSPSRVIVPFVLYCTALDRFRSHGKEASRLMAMGYEEAGQFSP